MTLKNRFPLNSIYLFCAFFIEAIAFVFMKNSESNSQIFVLWFIILFPVLLLSFAFSWTKYKDSTENVVQQINYLTHKESTFLNEIKQSLEKELKRLHIKHSDTINLGSFSEIVLSLSSKGILSQEQQNSLTAILPLLDKTSISKKNQLSNSEWHFINEVSYILISDLKSKD